MSFEAFNHTKKNGAQLLQGAREKYSDTYRVLQNAAKQGKRNLTRFGRNASETIAEGTDTVKAAAVTVNRKAHKDPWAFIGGAALAGLVTGYIMGRYKK